MAENVGISEVIQKKALKREETQELDGLIKLLGQELAASLDKLSNEERKMYVDEYIQKTGFPDLVNISEKIEEHATEVLLKVATKLGIQVLYSGYDASCSVGKRVALPGSDLDGWSIIIRGTEEQRQQLYQEIILSLDPAVFDLWSAYNGRIVTENDLMALGNLRDEDITQQSDQKAKALPVVCNMLKHGRALINALTLQEDWIKNLTQYHTSERFYTNFLDNAPKLKHQARELLSQLFPTLSYDEQFVVIRILQQSNEGVPIDLEFTSTHLGILASLQQKGLLSLSKNHFTPLWMHGSLNTKAEGIKFF